MVCPTLSPIWAPGLCSRFHSRQFNCQLLSASSLSGKRKLSLSWTDWRTVRGEYHADDVVSSQIASSPRTRSVELINLAAGGIPSYPDVAVGNERLSVPKPEKTNFIVREAQLDEELWAASWLRAESYCEDQPYVRYIESYKKKFAEQEFDALKRRLFGRCGQSIKCVCLVAVSTQLTPISTKDETGSATALERVVGTLDLSVRHLSNCEAFPGESIRATLTMGASDVQGPHGYGYVANVCVTKAARRKGVASNLLAKAIKTAKHWDLKELYVHVDSTNKAARHLYNKFNFQIMQAGAVDIGLQNVILLQLPL